MGRSTIATRLRQEMSLVLGEHPRLFYPVMRRKGRYRDLLISNRTEIVIEGYPRSGNTFAVAALKFAQQRAIAIANHTHSPAQVIEAVRRRLPTLVLLRQPRDAAVSLLIREPAIALDLALKRYIRFYSRIAAYRDDFVIATFDQATSDYAKVIVRINQRFRVGFAVFDHTPENCNRVFRIIEDMERAFAGALREAGVARPSPARNEPKARLVHALENGIYQGLLEECDGLYQEFRTRAEAPGAGGGPAIHGE
jgi:hypothetical protein